MKKTLSLLLALILLLPSCAANPGAAGTENPADNGSGAEAGNSAGAEEGPGETEFSADSLFRIEKTDYEGRTFHLLTTETQQYEFDAEEYTGEGVNDAIYDRNASVEELLGIEFDFIYRPGDWSSRDSFCKLIESSVLAADGAYDVTSGMVSCVMPIAGASMFHNLYDIPELNMENPWWVTEMP